MGYDFAGKQVLITGAASGIGRATALRLAREGTVLFLTDVNAGGLAYTVADARAWALRFPNTARSTYRTMTQSPHSPTTSTTVIRRWTSS